MNSIIFKLKDTDNKEYRVDGNSESSNLIINDNFILNICSQVGIENLKHLSLTLGANNMALLIKDYTLTDTVYIEGFYDVKSNISIFQTRATNIHMTGQTIQHMQIDCKSILLAECNIEKLDIGAHEQHKRMMNNQRDNIYKMDKVDLRNVSIGNLEIYAECNDINIQGSRIEELNNNGNMFKEFTSTVSCLHLWQNTNIGKLTISNKIKKFRIEDSSIGRLMARAKLLIDELEVKDSIIENCYGFKEKLFGTPKYESWQWIGKSAENSKDLRKRSEANYQMAKLLYQTEKKGDKFVSGIFDFCTGYGYKPLRIIRASGLVILLNTILLTLIKIVSILSISSIPLNTTTFYKGINVVWKNCLISFAALAGQNHFVMMDGLPYWLSVIEYLLGVILFAMFVNGLYVRYKE